MENSDLPALLKRVVELAGPDLRGYYRMPVKGRIVKTYASDGNYWADVQPTRNDESDDARAPVIPKVEVPVMWGGPNRGVICPIPEGVRVAVGFYDGDPNCPYIAHVRWHKNGAPACEVNGFIIQMAPGCHIKIDAEKNHLTMTPADARADIGSDMVINVGEDVAVTVGETVTVEVGGEVAVTAGGEVTVDAPAIRLNQGTGVVTGECICHYTGGPHGDLSQTVFAGK